MSKTTTLAKPTLGGKTTSAAALAFAEAGTSKGAGSAAAEKRIFFAPEGYRRLTINVTHEMHKKLRLMAVEQDTTITDILTKLVAKELG
jgi:hypothetical protein